jgi:hypothetical protein
MDSTAVLERYGAQLALAGNDRDCPLLSRVERDKVAETVADAVLELADGATVH